jgi:hypothetical protein
VGLASDNIFPKVKYAEGAAPATPASGQVVSYAKADGLLYSKDDAGVETVMSGGASAGFMGCFAYHSTTQAFNDATLTTISLDSELYDTSAFHDPATNSGARIVAPVTGYYRIFGGIWYATLTGTNYLLLEKNSSGVYIRGGAKNENGGTSGVSHSTTALLTAGDYITMVGYHTEAGSLATGDVGTTISQQNYLGMELIGV